MDAENELQLAKEQIEQAKAEVTAVKRKAQQKAVTMGNWLTSVKVEDANQRQVLEEVIADWPEEPLDLEAESSEILDSDGEGRGRSRSPARKKLRQDTRRKEHKATLAQRQAQLEAAVV